ncbi:LPD38 domain-containing protein [Simplicispira piscis]
MAQDNDWWKQGATAVDSAQPDGDWWKQGASPVDAPAAPKRTLGGTARDIGVTALKGAVGLPQAAVGLLDIPTGGHAGKAIEGAGVRFKDAQDTLDTMYSPAQQEANRKVREADGFLGTAKAMLENPSTIATGVGESIPQMLGGAGAARGAMALAPKLGPVLAGALGEGLVGAGSAAEQVRGQTQDGLLTGKQAALAGASGLATAGLGALGGKVAQRLGVGDVDTMLAGGTTRAAGQGSTRSTARQVLEGAVAEGALEEMPQSMAEQALQNVALDKPIGEGVGAAAAQGLITGTAMGGAGGGIGASGNRTQQRAQEHADAQATQSAEEATASAGALAEEARQPPTMDTIAGEPINPVDRGAPATFEDLVTPQPKPEVDPYTAWDQEAAASAPQAEAPAPVRPSEAMGIDPTAGPLSKGAALAVDSGVTDQMLQAAQAVQAAKESSKKAPAAQDSQAQAATQNVAQSLAELPPPTNLREGLERIRARRQEAASAQTAPTPVAAAAESLPAARAFAVEAAGPAPVSTTTGVTDGPQADQAQQTAPQQPQAPAEPGLTNAATTQNDGAQGQAAPGAQGAAPTAQAAVARPDGWRKSMLRAVPVAKSLGIDHKGKRLAQIVAEIDAADSLPSPIAATRAGDGRWLPSVNAGPAGGRAISGAPTFSDAGSAAHWSQLEQLKSRKGADVDSLVRQQERLTNPPSNAKSTPITRAGDIARGLRDQIDNVSADEKRPAMYRQEAQRLRQSADGMTGTSDVRESFAAAADMLEAWAGQVSSAPEINTQGTPDAATPRNLRLADERVPGAGAAAQGGAGQSAPVSAPAVGAGQRPGGGAGKLGAAVRTGVPAAGGASEQASGVAAPKGREVSRDVGKYKEGMSEYRANQVRSELARKTHGVIYTVEEDASLKNGYAVVGRATAPGKKVDAEKVRTTEERAPAMLSQAQPQMSQELAQSILALRRPPETATKDSVRAAVREMVNGLGMLPNRLGRVVVATSDEIKKEWEPLIGSVQMHTEQGGKNGKEDKNGAAQGFYDPASKTVFLIADNIKAGDELGVVAHELMHKHGPAVLGQEGWDKLHSAIGGWASAPKESMERTVYAEAARRVRKSRPADADVQGYSSQELFPYAVQVALEMGVRPNALAPQGTVARWLAQVRSALRTVWNKIASSKGDFNSLDLVNLAFGIAQRENPAHSGELDAAAVDGAARAQKALKEISDAEDLFALPKSEQSTVDGITAAHDPEIKVTTTDLGGETMYTLTMPDGTRATITSREPTKDEVFGMDESSERWITERPGEKAPPVGSRSDVWVDVSALKPGQNGARVYNIAATYAHNTGRIFIGDPSGLSDVALRRRAEQMLSSALKFGTTDHLAPHPRQVAGDAALGVPPLRWVYGDHAGNIDRLVDVNQKALENVFSDAKNLSYDLDTGNFIDDRTGTVLTREALARSADARGRSRGESEAGAGWKTTARSAVFRALLREERSGSEGGGQGGRFLGGLVSQRAKLASATERADERIFYSRSASSVAADDYSPAQQVAAERAFGTITKQTWAERAQSFRANLGTKLRQGLVDQFAPIKEVSQEAYMLARMSKGSDGAVEAALLYGKPFLRDGVTDVDMKDGGFAKVLASLKGEHDRFFQWVAAQRAERLKAEGRENLLTDQDISALRSLNAGKMADGTVRMPLYAKALQDLNAFNEASLKVALESGLIDQAAYDLMKDQPYVPFYRLMEDGDMKGPRFSSGLVNQQAWKKLKGGTQQISADLLQNTLLNWSHLYAAAARNRASLATMAEAEKLGIAYQVPADTKGAVKVMRDGVSEHWAVEDPYLLEAIAALNYSPGGIVKALAPFKRLLTFGVTVNPTFKIRNLIRDSLSAIAQSDLSYNPAENVAKGWKATSKASQTYASMLASGGIIKFGTQENTDHLRGHIERLGGTMLDKQGWEKLTGQMRSLWETYEEFGDRTENVNRAALYERLRAKGLSHAEASFQARDLMDFSMSGKWEAIRFLTQTVPFLNARMQGLYKLGRAANQDPRRFAAMAGAVSAASLALLAAYGDDDDWKKREDWDRDNYWWFKIGETAFRIPKPFEVGAIGTLAERTAELMMSEEMTGKRFGQRISDMVFNTFAMDPTPQAIKPFLDVYANKDSFSGRAIEGMADERLRPKDRYNERTSEVARLLGSWGLPDPVRLVKGEYAGLSPKQVDFLLRGYFGWLAVVTTTATDTVSRPLLDRGERPAMRMRDTFFAGNFVEALPTGSSRYVSQMYEQARSIEQAWASHQAAIKSGDTELASSIMEEDGDKLKRRFAVNNAKRQISELGQQVKRIESSKLLSADAKRVRLDEIEARRNAIAQRVATVMR